MPIFIRSLIVSVLLLLTGCSTLSFTHAQKPFDGTVHATSSLLCSGYLSNHGPNGETKGRSVARRIVPTIALVGYGAVDLVSSLIFDALVYVPQRFGLIEPGRTSASDDIAHSLLPCGTLDSSIHTVLQKT